MALLPGTHQPVRTALFPTRKNPDGFVCDLPKGAAWSPGNTLDLLTPVGTGFSPPRTAYRWLLWAIGCPPSRLLPLIDLGLSRHAAIALAAAEMPPHLSAQVELAAEPFDALAWADYLAIDLAPESIPWLEEHLLGAGAPFRRPRDSQVLIATPMPCGIGVCSACAVQTRRGWKRACVDGPVFDLAALAR